MELVIQVAAGVILLILGGLGSLLWRRLRREKGPPTAAEIAKARLDEEQRREDDKSAAAEKLYDLLNETIHRVEADVETLGKLRNTKTNAKDMQAPLEKWRALRDGVAVLRRDDIVKSCDSWFAGIVQDYAANDQTLAMSRRLANSNWDLTQDQQSVEPARAARSKLISLKYGGSAIRDKVSPLRTRLGSPPR